MTNKFAWLLLALTPIAGGCGEPPAPPPGAPTEAPEAPQIEGVTPEAESSDSKEAAQPTTESEK